MTLIPLPGHAPVEKQADNNELFACDAMVCDACPDAHAFCFYCGDGIPLEDGKDTGRNGHGSHFGEIAQEMLAGQASTRYGWCIKRSDVVVTSYLEQKASKQSLQRKPRNGAAAARLLGTAETQLTENPRRSNRRAAAATAT